MLVIPDNRKVVDLERDLYIEDQPWIEQATLAQKLLAETDFVVTKAMELGETLNPEWRAWRAELREVARGVLDRVPNPQEPERYS